MQSAAKATHAVSKDEEFFKWDTSRLGLGVEAMDAEHQKLIQLMNQLHSLAQSIAPRGQVDRVLDQLASYTLKHFDAEERYMKSIGFPELITHQQIHKTLLEKFTIHAKAFKASKEDAPSAEFFTFLKIWLQAHIAGVDRKYANHRK